MTILFPVSCCAARRGNSWKSETLIVGCTWNSQVDSKDLWRPPNCCSYSTQTVLFCAGWKLFQINPPPPPPQIHTSILCFSSKKGFNYEAYLSLLIIAILKAAICPIEASVKSFAKSIFFYPKPCIIGLFFFLRSGDVCFLPSCGFLMLLEELILTGFKL